MAKRRKKRIKNGYILWNAVAVGILLVSLFGYYWTASVRVAQGYWTADPFIMLIHEIFHNLLMATFIGWIIGNLIAKTKGKR